MTDENVYGKCDRCDHLIRSTVSSNPVKDGETHPHCGGRIWHVRVVPDADARGGGGGTQGTVLPDAPADAPTRIGSTALYNQDPEKGGVKNDAGKVLVELVPPEGIWGVARVFTLGAKKYAPRNWEKGMSRMRLIGSSFRHLMAMTFGQKNDPETKMPHSWHLGCNAMMYIALEARGGFVEEPEPKCAIEMLDEEGQ